MIRKTTIWILGAVIVIMILWDVIAYLSTENATFSVVITDWSYYTPWMPFALGFLMGHWFAPAKGSNDK